MGDETYIAVVRIHSQPPIDTPGTIRTHTKTFGQDDGVRAVWDWAMSHRHGDYETIVSLEIRPNE